MEKHFKQLIIARRDLNMSPGKFLIEKIDEILFQMVIILQNDKSFSIGEKYAVAI